MTEFRVSQCDELITPLPALAAGLMKLRCLGEIEPSLLNRSRWSPEHVRSLFRPRERDLEPKNNKYHRAHSLSSRDQRGRQHQRPECSGRSCPAAIHHQSDQEVRRSCRLSQRVGHHRSTAARPRRSSRVTSESGIKTRYVRVLDLSDKRGYCWQRNQWRRTAAEIWRQWKEWR